MAVYFDHPVDFPSGTSADHHLMKWHDIFPILAVSSKNAQISTDGSVNFFLEEGTPVEESSIHRSMIVECMEWHPKDKVIAIGWYSGEITTFNMTEKLFHEQSSIHRSPILCIQWNQNGTRLISGDKSGLLVVWKVEELGKLHPTPLHQHRLHSPIRHCAMLHPIAMAKKSSVKGKGVSVLDSYTWKNKGAAITAETVSDPISCFCITQEGALYFMNNSGDCVERFRLDGTPLAFLLSIPEQMLSVITEDMFISQFSITHDGQATVTTAQAKLGGRNKVRLIINVVHKLLASCSDENIIRFWDFANNDNFSLDIQHHTNTSMDEVVQSIAYNHQSKVLAGGTNMGNLFLWKWKETGSVEPENWEFITIAVLPGPLLDIAWYSKKNQLAVSSGKSVAILSEHIMNSHFNEGISVIQVSPNEILVECHGTQLRLAIRADLHIKGTYATKEHIAVWSGRTLEIYFIVMDKGVTRLAGSFATTASKAVLYEQSVFTMENDIKVRTFQGTVKQILAFMEPEGYPIAINITGHYLIAGSSNAHLKMWDISRREAKIHGSTDLNVIPDLKSVISVHCGSGGNKVSVIAEKGNSRVPILLIWFLETDCCKVFAPSEICQVDSALLREHTAKVEDPYCLTFPDIATASLQEQYQLMNELSGRWPMAHHWDPFEPILAIEWTYNIPASPSHETDLSHKDSMEKYGITKSRSGRFTQANQLVCTFFVTQEMNILINDMIPVEPFLNSLIGIGIPFLFYSKKATAGIMYRPSNENLDVSLDISSSISHPPPSSVAQVVLRDFVGLEDTGSQVIHAMVEFSYHMAIGNMEEAFKSIKLIKSQHVWEIMARMCVKTRRLDVASVCLGYMGNARAARAVREARATITEPDAQLAVLAIELGMLADAERLYKESKRYDLLNEYYQFTGQWSKALEIAGTKDRLHLNLTYYNFARHAEEIGELNAAITSYEKSGTHRIEVPRMLLDHHVGELEGYVMKSKDESIRKWWAEYLESLGEWEQALQFYETARDYYSLVRILCFNGQIDKAAEIVEESGDKAAAYHLARRLSVENEDPKRAIHFFIKAKCFSPAIQLAKENGLDHDLMNLALLGSQENMLDAAKYYENSTNIDRAVLLYHKAGEISHALDLVFKHRQYDSLDQIADDLTEDSHAETTQRVADYYMEKGLFDKSMELLVRTKKAEEALKLCQLHSVPLTEELVDKISVPQKDDETPQERERRIYMQDQLGDCCLTLGAYHLAAKEYTKAGNKTKAMKALLKSGDTEKILFFAGVSRQPDIYVMAANYLQTLDWRKDPSIIKNIISYYTKGKALESLAGFYDACAQTEIDEFQNYAKAAGALDEAVKVLEKIKTKNQTTSTKLELLKERKVLVQKFADARRLFDENPKECIQQCQLLLDEPNLEAAIRVGDIYGLMIEYNAESGNFDQAYSLMKEMQQRIPNVNFTYYIDIRVIENIHKALGIPLGRGTSAGEKKIKQEEEHEEEEVESEVEETF